MSLLGRLDRLATENPSAFLNAGNLTVLRLALTAAYGSDGVTALDVERAAQEAARKAEEVLTNDVESHKQAAEREAAQAKQRLFRLEQERSELRDRVKSLSTKVDQQARDLAKHESNNQHATLKMEISNLQATISLVQKALGKDVAANTLDLVRKDPLATKVLQVSRERNAFQESSSELGSETDDLRQRLTTALNAPKLMHRRITDSMEVEAASRKPEDT